VNPATGQELEGFPVTPPEQVEAILDAARRAQEAWRRTDFLHRARRMERAAALLREGAEDFGALITREMGKPLAAAISEVEKCARVCDYYATHAEAQLAPEPVETPDTEARTYVAFQPLGVVLAIMPWNFPFWQAFRFLSPALMAGNGAILKHAANVPGCARAIEGVFHGAGFPPDLLRAVLVDHREVERIIAHPVIRAVTLTGSGRAGREVAAQAGRALKKTVLELGGSDPYLVLEDADLESAVEACVTSRLTNSGQSCIAAKRFIVVDAVADAFQSRLVDRMAAARMGDPMEAGMEVGPQAREDLREELHRQVQESVDAGARCLLGGEIPEGPGFFYPPTVLADVRPGMPAFDEELFGPVAAVIRTGDEAEAIRLANHSDFGLGAAVFTRDRERGERIAREELEAGACFVNDFVRSDPRLPFGGVKESGYGRELSSFGIREFVNVKTVWVE
jgi:succinate-semialdehyde dehydrogenase / glutarate-semialdehyde dehydrogenase